MKLVRTLVPGFLATVALACSGGTGGTFSVLDGVYDEAPTHGYDSPGGASTLEGGRSDAGQPPRSDAGSSTPPTRPVACGTVLQCTVSGSKVDLTYDCALFRTDGKLVGKEGTETGTWTASGTTITIQSKSADGGAGTRIVCIPKPATPDAGKDTGVVEEN